MIVCQNVNLSFLLLKIIYSNFSQRYKKTQNKQRLFFKNKILIIYFVFLVGLLLK